MDISSFKEEKLPIPLVILNLVLDVIVKLANYEASLSLVVVSPLLLLIWFVLVCSMTWAVWRSIESLRRSVKLDDVILFLVPVAIFILTSVVFVQLGLHFGYLVSVLLFVVSILLGASSFYQARKRLRKVWRTHLGKTMIVAGALALFIIPLVGALVRPLFDDPVVNVSPELVEVYLDKAGDEKQLTVYVKATEGYAWNVQITTESPSMIYVYVDNILNGTKRIDYLEFDKTASFALRIVTSRSIGNGHYNVKIRWSYSSWTNKMTQKSLNILVLVRVHVRVEEWSIILILWGVLLVIALLVVWVVVAMQRYERVEQDSTSIA